MKYQLLNLIIFACFSVPGFANICGINDDRISSSDEKVGRMLLSRSGGSGLEVMNCTVTMVSDSCGITAGHCLDFNRVRKQVEFNVPKSKRSGDQTPTRREHRYYINDQYSNFSHKEENRKKGISGSDWAVLKLKRNRKTNKYPGEAYGYYLMNTDLIDRISKPNISITSYGIASRFDKDKSLNYTQRISYGRIKSIVNIGFMKEFFAHNVDTMPGSSGAAILNQKEEVIGIHSAGGCNKKGDGANRGTLLFQSPSFIAAIKSCIQSELF